jgi:hypothetical protein
LFRFGTKRFFPCFLSNMKMLSLFSWRFVGSLAAVFAFAAALDAAPQKSAPPPTPLQQAAALERTAHDGKLPEARFHEIAAALQSPDIFVRALGHAAAAQIVGHANNGDVVKISAADAAKPDAPAWLKAYAAVAHEDLVAYDWIRHLAAEGKLFSSEALRNEVLLCHARARRAGLGINLAGILEKIADADEAACRALWLETRRLMRPAVLAASGVGDTLLLQTRHGFHYKPNVCGTHTSWSYKPGGDILAVNVRTGAPHPFLSGRLGAGHLHGFDLSFDGKRAVFSFASQPVWPPPKQFSTVWPRNDNACFARELRDLARMTPTHLYELDLSTNEFTQLTDHNYWGDTEPAYLPDGGIVFASDRAGNSPSCDSTNNDLSDLNLYVLNPDRRSIRRLLNHKDIDTHPRVLNNGLVAYLRWEYQERNFMETHSVWTARPDGSNADALFKQHNAQPYSVRLAGSLGSGNKLLAIATGHHALPQGALVILNPGTGINNPAGIEVVTRGMWINEGGVPGRSVAGGGREEKAGGFYTDPHGYSENAFVASYAFPSRTARRYPYERYDVDSNGYGAYLVDVFGNKELLYRDPFLGVYGARPLRARKTPPQLPDTTDRSKNYAVCSIPNVYQGMEGVAPGTIRYIRVAEALPWRVIPGEGVKRWTKGWTNQAPDATRWCPVRIIGDVPVEADGSAHFKVPVTDSASVYFQALDENFMEIRRMRSSVSFSPGEQRSCNGCHETNPTVPAAPRAVRNLALSRPPSDPAPFPWGSRQPIHFARDVQPIFTKNCVSCHSGATAKAGLDLAEGKAFNSIRRKKLVVLSNCNMNSAITRVKQFGSHASRLTQALVKQEKMQVKLTPLEWRVLTAWVDANTPHSGEMWHKLTSDGRKGVWGNFDWGDPWGLPKEVPARGDKIVFTPPDENKVLTAAKK